MVFHSPTQPTSTRGRGLRHSRTGRQKLQVFPHLPCPLVRPIARTRKVLRPGSKQPGLPDPKRFLGYLSVLARDFQAGHTTSDKCNPQELPTSSCVLMENDMEKVRSGQGLAAAHAVDVRTSEPDLCQPDQTAGLRVRRRLSAAHVTDVWTSSQRKATTVKFRPDVDTEDRHDPILNQRTKNRRSSRCRSLVSRLQSQSLEHESVSFHFQHRSAGDDSWRLEHVLLPPVQCSFTRVTWSRKRSSGQVMRHIAPSSCRTRATWGGQRVRMVILGRLPVFLPAHWRNWRCTWPRPWYPHRGRVRLASTS